MTTIVIKPKSKAEKNFLTRLLKKMNIEAQVVEEPMPNYETRKAMEDVEKRKGIRAKDAQELFNMLDI
jgi:reverse gyrase